MTGVTWLRSHIRCHNMTKTETSGRLSARKNFVFSHLLSPFAIAIILEGKFPFFCWIFSCLLLSCSIFSLEIKFFEFFFIRPFGLINCSSSRTWNSITAHFKSIGVVFSRERQHMTRFSGIFDSLPLSPLYARVFPTLLTRGVTLSLGN